MEIWLSAWVHRLFFVYPINLVFFAWVVCYNGCMIRRKGDVNMGNIYLVTGGAGHLGSAVALALCARGDRVRILALPTEKHMPKGDVQVFYGDVCVKESLEPFFMVDDGDDAIVIHCAGIVTIKSKYDSRVHEVNVGGTKNVVDMCVQHHVKKLVHVSSVHAIPENPDREMIFETVDFSPEKVVGLYAKTKAEATDYVLRTAREKNLNVSVVHPSGISGPYDNGKGHLTTLVEDYCNHRLTAAVRGGYDFVDVRDVADGVIACCEKGSPQACYILSNRYFDLAEILTMLHEITGKKQIKTFLPIWFVKLTAPFAELFYKMRGQTPLYTAYSIYTLESNANFSHDKATRELGYTTRDMVETLSDTVQWLRENNRI